MVTAEQFHTAQLGLSAYYLKKLEHINRMFNMGGENAKVSLQLFDQEWEQIRKWQSWAVENAGRDARIARIAAAFPRLGNAILKMRLNNQEYLDWNKAGFECSERWHDTQFRFEELLNLAFAWQRIYDYQTASVYARMALDDCHPENLYDQALACDAMAVVARRLGNMPEARSYYEKSLELYRGCSAREQQAGVLYNLSSLAGMEGDFSRARDYLNQALPFYRQRGDLHNVSNCLNNLGLVEYSEGQLDLANNYLQESLEISELLNYRSNMSQALTNLAAVAMARGAYDQVHYYETRSLALSRELGDMYGIAMSVNNLGKVAYIRSEFETAESCFRDALEILQQMEDRYSMVECLCDLGLCAQIRHDDKQAEILFLQGADHARAVSHQTGLMDNLRALAGLYMRLRRFVEARAVLYESLTVALDIKSVLYQTKVLLSSAQLWHTGGDSATAGQWLGLASAQSTAEPRMRRELEETRALLSGAIDGAKLEALLEAGANLSLADVLVSLLTQLKNHPD